MDKFYRERIKIIGGPGCGKTTKLLEILKHQFRNGLKHDQVAMVAFDGQLFFIYENDAKMN